MTRRPRTPLHWPRMKVRGRRNRTKLAQRIETRFVIPFAVPKANDDGSFTFEAMPGPTAGAHRIEGVIQTTDGFGRAVPTTRRMTAVPAVTRPRNAFSFGLQFKSADLGPLADLLFGGARDAP